MVGRPEQIGPEEAFNCPQGDRGRGDVSAVNLTGGVLSFGQIGALASPAVFSLLLGLTAGYSAGWLACVVPAVLVSVNMLRQGKPVRGHRL